MTACKTSKLDAATLVATHLASCVPAGTPPAFRTVINARFEGVGRKMVAIAVLEMFDGLTATIEVFKWATNALGHRWTAMEGGAAFYEDGKWQRDIA